MSPVVAARPEHRLQRQIADALPLEKAPPGKVRMMAGCDGNVAPPAQLSGKNR
jgi:hypothetical protein